MASSGPKFDEKCLSRVNDTSKATGAVPWSSWLVPSFSDVWFISILLLLSAGGLAPKLLGDAGIGWHIRNGQQILRTRAIPHVDAFSATMGGQPWFAWEWLYDLLIAVVHACTGLNGVVFLTAFIIALTFVLALHFALRSGASLPVAILLLALSLGASSIHFLTRPHVLSWLFCVIWFSILDGGSAKGMAELGNRLYWLPLIMLFWANVHGGFLLGLILCGLYLVAGAFQYVQADDASLREQAGKRLRVLSAMTGLSFFASLVNPYGGSLYLHIYRYLGDRFLMDHIDEFESPNFHGVGQKCFGLLLLITLVGLAANRAKMKIKTAHWLVILFAAYSGLYSSRNLPVSSLLLTLTTAPLLSREIEEAGKDSNIAAGIRSMARSFSAFGSRVAAMESRFRGHVWPAIAIAGGLWVCMHNGHFGSHQLMNAQFSKTRFPVEAADFIRQQNIHEPIFAPDYWGGYLIYTLYPANQVFVDDRHDLYGSTFFRQYLTTVQVEPGWNDLLDHLNVRWVLVPCESPLANILKETPSWSVLYQDNTAVLFHRTVH